MKGTEVQFTHAKPGIGKSLFALFLMLATPTSAMLIWYTLFHLDGSITALFQAFVDKGPLEVFQKAWFDHFWGSATAWKILGIYIPIQIVMMKVPANPTKGP
ncbi:MAG: 7-dehydrocholesterol reductase [Bacteroidota bacterium]|jgi:hypothetical protein